MRFIYEIGLVESWKLTFPWSFKFGTECVARVSWLPFNKLFVFSSMSSLWIKSWIPNCDQINSFMLLSHEWLEKLENEETEPNHTATNLSISPKHFVETDKMKIIKYSRHLVTCSKPTVYHESRQTCWLLINSSIKCSQCSCDALSPSAADTPDTMGTLFRITYPEIP